MPIISFYYRWKKSFISWKQS